MLGNRVALVTGAGQGIGKAIAVALAQAGADVVVNDLSLEVLEDTVEAVRAFGCKALALVADVSDRDAVRRMIGITVEHFGHVDVVVSNAGWNERQLVVDADWETVQRVIAVHQFGMFHLCQAAAQQMLQQDFSGTNIVIIGSVHADVPFAHNAAYAMSKAAAVQFGKVLAKELAPHGVRVNVIQPGWTDTPGERRFLNEASLQEGGKQLPLGRLADAAEVAAAVVFVASEQASYITGSVIDVDGGFKIAVDRLVPQDGCGN